MIFSKRTGKKLNRTTTTKKTKQGRCAESSRVLVVVASLTNHTEHVGKENTPYSSTVLLSKREQRLGEQSSRTSETPGAEEVEEAEEAEEQRCQKKGRSSSRNVFGSSSPAERYSTKQDSHHCKTGDCVRQWNGDRQRAGELGMREKTTSQVTIPTGPNQPSPLRRGSSDLN